MRWPLAETICEQGVCMGLLEPLSLPTQYMYRFTTLFASAQGLFTHPIVSIKLKYLIFVVFIQMFHD
jgi:hypothetical protein